MLIASADVFIFLFFMYALTLLATTSTSRERDDRPPDLPAAPLVVFLGMFRSFFLPCQWVHLAGIPRITG